MVIDKRILYIKINKKQYICYNYKITKIKLTMSIANFNKEVTGQSGDVITEYKFNYKNLSFNLQCFSDDDYNISAVNKKNSTSVVIGHDQREIQFTKNDKHNNIIFDCILQITKKNTFLISYFNVNDKELKEENIYIDNNEIYYKKKGLRKFPQTMKSGYLLLNDSNILLYQLLTDENLKENSQLNRMINTIKNFENSDYKKIFEEMKTITPENIRQRKICLDYIVQAVHEIGESILEINNNKKSKNSLI